MRREGEGVEAALQDVLIAAAERFGLLLQRLESQVFGRKYGD
jgi:hypothetical protein